MCGILAILSDIITDKSLQDLKLLIDSRGPDYSSQVECIKTECELKLRLHASVLHLRGSVMQKQPVLDQDNNCLVFNGQIYEFDSKPLNQDISDTTFLFEKLVACEERAQIAETFAAVDGPFAFVYWSSKLKTLFYGRDFFGRKSLCLLNNADTLPFMISSIGLHCNNNYGLPADCLWSEVDCSGLHCIDFSGNEPKRTIFGWQVDKIYPRSPKCGQQNNDPSIELIPIKRLPLEELNRGVEEWSSFSPDQHRQACLDFGELFLGAVRRRIDYDRKVCLICRREKGAKATRCEHSKVVVAFSGGIDSTVIALALDKVLDKSETIDLSSVAFKDESPDRLCVGLAYDELRKLRPERRWRLILADVRVNELREERERTIANLILPCKTVIDDSLGCGCWFIGRAAGRALDSDKILDHKTIESFSKYRPEGCSSTHSSYVSPASTIFAGMGIDEQLGGYSSHRAAWSAGGAGGRSRAVVEEIAFQMRRLPTRNLGRDDRCFSHHARDVKLPFLDFRLVSYLNQLPLGLKMNLEESLEHGPKKILRQLALGWGLRETSLRVKRALQFGTRIANLEDPKEKGNNVCLRLAR